MKYEAIVHELANGGGYLALIKLDGKTIFKQHYKNEQAALSAANAELKKLKREDERKAP